MSVTEALDRLAARPGANDTNLLALVAEWRMARVEANRLFKEHSSAEEADEAGSDPDGERRSENADKVVVALANRLTRDIPAQTIAGLAAKLEVAFVETGSLMDHQDEWASDEWSLWSCWQDAKRLAAGD